MKAMRMYQINYAGQYKTPLEEIDPPLNEEEKEYYYAAMRQAEEFRRETGREPMFYVPADACEDEDYIENIYSDDFDKRIHEALNKKQEKKNAKKGKSKKKHK